MERKIQKRYKNWSRALLPLTCLTLADCAQPAKFSSVIDSNNVHYVSAAHNVFVAGRSAREELSFSFQPKFASQDIRMQAAAAQKVTLQQIERPLITDSFTQGNHGQSLDEEFPVSMLDTLDLLVVVDDSSSMSPYQQKLATGLAPLLSEISNTDWRIMVTSTSPIKRRNPADPSRIDRVYGCPRINPANPNDKAVITRADMLRDPRAASDQFAWKVMIGESGDPIEHGVLAATSGLAGECGQSSQAWVRPHSHKAVLILTDEENCGSDPDQNCDGDADSNPQYFIDQAPAGTQFFALLHDQDVYAECQDAGYIRKPDDYRWLINRTGGKEGNICIGNYGSTLAEISKNMHPVPRLEYDLAFTPQAGSIQLSVDGRPWTSDYTVNGRRLILNTRPPAGAKALKISYRHDPAPVVSSFAFSAPADLMTAEVKLNGSIVPRSLYSLDSRGIVFATAPAEFSKIELSYRAQQKLPQSFPIPEDALLETLSASVDAQAVSDFMVVGVDSREIYFPRPPRDGATIVLSFESPASRTLEYPSLNFNKSQVEQVTAFDKETRAAIALSWDKQRLLFNRDDVRDARAVQIVYQLVPESDHLLLAMHQKPQAGTLSISAKGANKDCVRDVAKAESELRFPCAPQKLGELTIAYDYISQIDQKFRMRGEFSQKAVWIVKVNGTETKDYELHDDVVAFPEAQFDADTVVDIEVLEPVRT